MGILNVTPDSFSDGGMFLDAAAADADMTVLILDNETVGMTGAQDPIVPSSRLHAIVLGAVGRAHPLVDVRILDPDGKDVPAGEVGEVASPSPVLGQGGDNPWTFLLAAYACELRGEIADMLEALGRADRVLQGQLPDQLRQHGVGQLPLGIIGLGPGDDAPFHLA